MEAHIHNHTSEPFKCDVKIRCKQRMEAHICHHTGEKPVMSDAKVRCKQRMKAHICHHTGEMPFKLSVM